MTVKASAFDMQVLHLAGLATTPGWWAYAQQRAIEMEADESAVWAGIRAEVGKLVKAAKWLFDLAEQLPRCGC